MWNSIIRQLEMDFVVWVGTKLVVPERGIFDQDFGKGFTLGGIEVFAVRFNPIVDINCFVLVGSKSEIGIGKGISWGSMGGTILRHGIIRNKVDFVIIEEVIIECVNVQVHSKRRSFSWFGWVIRRDTHGDYFAVPGHGKIFKV